MGWYDAFKGNTAAIDIGKHYRDDTGAKNLGDAFGNIGKTMIDYEAQKDKSALSALRIQNEQNKLDEFAETKKQQKFDDAYTRDALNFSKKDWDETNKIAKADTGQSLESLYGASAPTAALQDKTFRTNEANKQLDIDKAFGEFTYNKSKKDLADIAAGDNSRKLGIEALQNENKTINPLTYNTDANIIPNSAYVKNEQEIKNLQDAFSPIYGLTPSVAAQEQLKAREQAQTALEIANANSKAKADYVKKVNPNLVDVGGDGSTLMDINKVDTDNTAKLLALKTQENEIKNATEINKLNAALANQAIKYAHEKLKEGVNKPFSLAEQAMTNKLFAEDFYKLDSKGKVTITDGNAELKSGVSPEQVKFVQQQVSNYMGAKGSDKNYNNARDIALQSWAETSQAKAEAIAKQEENSKSWLGKMFSSKVTPEEIIKREQINQTTQVQSKDNYATVPTASTIISKKENNSSGWEKFHPKTLNQK